MRDFLLWLFMEREEPFDITLFSFWHIFYALLIIASTIALGVYLSKKDGATQEKYRRALAYSIVFIYIIDFFIQPFFLDGQMNVDKLPFHICTILSPTIAFVQFNKRFEKIAEPIAVLAIASAIMYITYPGSAIGTESPFCYRVIQTFVYHGVTMAWGYVSLSTGAIKLNIKKCYHALIVICLIALWAAFGNAAYSSETVHYDWFFITGSTFPFIPAALMPLCAISAVFAVVMGVYGLYYLVMHFVDKKASKSATEEKETVNV